jgi:phospholipid/cholesterol/gamma-HCH transport system substrate-binding protein
MKRRMVFAQLSIFGVISVLVAYYALFHVMGLSLTARPYEVKVIVRTGGGIFTGAEVTYRGVRIGSVTGMKLEPSEVVLTLDIEEGKKVPKDAVAHVSNLSAVGEQYLDFMSGSGDGPYLTSGSVVPMQQTTTPPKTATVLFDLEQWINSIDPGDLGTLSTELAEAFAGTGPELRRIVASGVKLVDALDDTRSSFTHVLHNSSTVLRTAAKHAGDFATFTRSVLQISQTLRSATPTIEKFLDEGPSTTALVNDIIRQDGSSIAVLLGNLMTFSQIQVANIPGWKALLIAVPQFELLVPRVVRNGTVHGLGVINYTEPVCSYGPTLTSPISRIKTPVASVSCPDPAPGTLARGAQNAPLATSGRTTNSATEQLLGVSARVTRTGSAQVGAYNPDNGIVVNDQGQAVRLGWNGGQVQLLGAESWQAVFLSGIGN